MHRLVAAVIVLAVLAGCGGNREERLNVRPPAPGRPASPASVAGIYRSIHQAVLQLRADGSFNLIAPDEPKTTTGTFSLTDGHLEVTSGNCGTDVGRYHVVVTGKQQAGKATLNITTEEDACRHRARHLTVDPWVYADS